MIKIAICDDNREDIELAKIRLNEISRGLQCDFEIYEFMDDEMMVENIIKQGIEVVLLDIDMPNITGMDVANRLNQEKPFINIIFLTNREELVFQTLKYRPLRFIRKNCMQAELGEAMEVAIKKIAAETYYPGFTRRNYLKGYKYNMDLASKMLLIEVGAQTNTVNEIKNAMEPLAEILHLVVGY